MSVVGPLQGRAGGGSHSGSSSSSSSGHSSSSYSGGGSGGGFSLGGLIVFALVALILWLIFRRFIRATPSGQALAGAPLAREAIGAVLGAASGRGIAGGGFGAAGVGAAGVGRAGPGGIILGAAGLGGGAFARPGLPAAIDTIRAQDPGFEIETFLQRAEMTFFLVKRGLQKGDPAAVRPYLNDGVFAVVSGSMKQMATQHQHVLMEGLNVRDVHLIEAANGPQGQSLVVHFDMVYRAKTLDASNQVLADEGEDRRRGERWTFTRAAAARTPVDGGVTASRCPACGAELRLSVDGTCTYCRASVTNGTVDWVVADVQPAPFLGYTSDPLTAVAAPTVADGIATLRATDSNFDMNAFLGRVQTGFMTLQDAWCRQNLEAGRAFLSPGAYFAWRAQLETMAAEGRRNVMEGLAIRGIVPIRVIHGRVFDDLTVRISAQSSDYEVDRSEHIVFGDRTVRPFTEEWTFQRSVGVSTSSKAGTLESTCPSCGAPVALTQLGECRYCKAAVTSGKFDWVVSRIEQEDDAAGTESGLEDLGAQVASAVGGAIVGGLLSNLFSKED